MIAVESRTAERRTLRLAFHASRIVIDLGVLIVLGSMSLPFVLSDGGNRSAITADALPTLLLMLPIFAITMIPDHSRPLPAPLGWLSLVLAVAALPYSVVKYLDASTVAETIGGDVGTGARLLVFGTLVTVAGIVIGLARSALRLPSGGTYPARPQTRPQPARARAREAAGTASPTTPAAQSSQAAPAPVRPRRPAPAESVPERPVGPDPLRRGVPPGSPTRRAVAPQDRAASQQRQPPQTQPAEQPGRSDAPETPKVVPPRARRPVINPRAEHEALPSPRHPSGELPLPHRRVEPDRPADDDPEASSDEP